MSVAAGRLPGLDGLRIGAALALLVCHAGFWLAPLRLADSVWLLLGHVGVEAFLVFAGFLAARRSLAAQVSDPLWRSWARVGLRLLPLYFLLLVVNLALAPEAQDIPLLQYLTLTQNLAWPHPPLFGEAWIVAAAALLLLMVAPICAYLRRQSFARGLLVLVGAIALAHVARAAAVIHHDPAFDAGVRKVLVWRLDLPFYGVLMAWLWTRREDAIRHLRVPLGAFGALALVVTAIVHLWVAVDHDVWARVFLVTLCDIGWLALGLWACTLWGSGRAVRASALLAGSFYAGLLTHMTLLRIGAELGMPTHADDLASGVLLLSAYVVVATGLALLVRGLLDRPLLALRERWVPARAQHRDPVLER